MFVCRSVRTKSGSVGRSFFFFFFFFLSVCVWKPSFFQIEKNIQVLTFMLSIYSCLPMFFMFLKFYRKKNSTGAKNNGSVGRFFLFFEKLIKKTQKSAGFSRVSQVTANKQFCYALQSDEKLLLQIALMSQPSLPAEEESIRTNRPLRIRDCCDGEVVTNHRQMMLANAHHDKSTLFVEFDFSYIS